MRANDNALFLPKVPSQLGREEIWQWFRNIPRELRLLALEDAERDLFESYYREAGLLRSWRESFFRHHYASLLLSAVRRLFMPEAPQRILDLGAGTGTQSLLFALLGADVVAVDLDDVALSILRKRKTLYEELSGRRLNIQVVSGNIFDLNLDMAGPFTGIYSLFAFNMMQPTKALLKRLAPHLAAQAALAIQDGNRMHLFNRVFRKRAVLSRDELRSAFADIGFQHVEQTGGCAIPPLVWAFLPSRILEPIDQILARYEAFAVSYLHLAWRR